MAYADFQYYMDIFRGTLISDSIQFGTLSERASEYIDMVTFNRLEDENLLKQHETNIKKCCCALAENIFRYDLQYNTDVKSSESIGAYSVSYSNPLDNLTMLSGSTFLEYQYKTALKYLGCTGLMYRGLD